MGIYSRIKGLFFWKAFFLIILASLLIPPQSFSALPGDLVIGNYTLVSQTRVGRTTWDYTYHATITNNGAIGVRNVYAKLTSPATGATVLDGSLTFGEVPAGATVTSSDTFQIRVDRSYPFDQSNLVWSINYETVNSPPVANAGIDQTAYVGNTVQLNGAGSTDVDGDILTYNWSFVSRPAGSAAALSDPTAVNPSFVIDKFGNYKIQLIVNDGTENSAPHTVIVSTLNSAPVANAGPDQTVNAGTTVNLNGSGSTDADGDALTYSWSFVSRPPGSMAALLGATDYSPSFVADKPGNYMIQLVVNDGKVDSASDTVTITTQNSRPVANAGSDQTVYVGDTVTLDGSGSSDADNDPLTFRWSFTSVPSESTAAISDTAAMKPSFVPDLPDLYVAQLIVNDGKIDSFPDTVSITANVKTTTVPDVAGLTQSAAQSAIITAKLIVGGITMINSPTVPAGQVISQNPTAGTSVAEGSSVSLVISTGPVMVNVPDVVGMSQADAQSSIIASNLTVGTITTLNSATVPVGYVISQDPVAGTSAAEGSSVNLVISLGPVMVTVPNVIGITQAAAESAITTASLTVGTVTTANSDTVPAGNVISQNPAGGNSVPQGTSINFVISLGPQGPVLPPDPSAVAPPLDRTVATTIGASNEFLYTGPNPIQTGVAPGAIEPKRACVLRGRVLTRDGAELSGVKITILNHPEFGSTVSRADGMFDMAVNGGGYLTANYEKAGYLPAQRQVKTPWQDYVWLPDVVLIQADTNVTAIDLSSAIPIQVARGSVVNDSDGTRQATLLFPQGVQADLTLPDGTRQPLTTMHVRATEYTVGENGPKAMPAELPPTSAYTYAVELSVDEAIAAGAREVTFDRPVYTYVDNFLGFPVGGDVPAGYYDRSLGQWIASDNGVVIKILSVTGGMVDVDVDGSNQAATASQLAALSITDAERQELAGLYQPNQSLWRVPTMHFSTKDFNWGLRVPADATSPDQPNPFGQVVVDNPTCEPGSIIGCQNQVLGEAIDVAGTPFALHYQSDRVPGRKEPNTLEIQLSGASVPASLAAIWLEVYIAGRLYSEHAYPPQPNQTKTFVWDGKDARGRLLQGRQPIVVRLGYVYRPSYVTVPAFGMAAYITGEKFGFAREPVILWQGWKGEIGHWDARPQGLGGWSLNVHHGYDTSGSAIYMGDGRKRNANILSAVITTIATAQWMSRFSAQVAGPDGSIYLSSYNDNRVYRVGTDGRMTIVAGVGQQGYSGDGGPATQAHLTTTGGLAIGPDGSLYICDVSNYRVRRVATDGIITTVAGNGVAWAFSGDGGLATQAGIGSPDGVAVAADGTLYIAAPEYQGGGIRNWRVRRVGTDGIINTVYTAEWIDQIATGPDGSLYVLPAYEWGGFVRIRTDGTTTTVAGTRYYNGFAVGPDGAVYLGKNPDWYEEGSMVDRVGTDGSIARVAGRGRYGVLYSGEGGPASQAQLGYPTPLAIAPDGSLYIVDFQRLLRVAPPMPGLSLLDFIISSEDGSELYVFNSGGRHLRTLDAVTGALRYNFTYNAAGKLDAIADNDGNTVTIERDATGNATAIVSPYGQRTTLTSDANGYLASITNPKGESVQLASTSDGLLTGMTDPRGFVHTFSYDALGRLVKDKDPAGGFKTLNRTDVGKNYSVSLSTAMNRTTTYRVEEVPASGPQMPTILDQKRVTTSPSGLSTETILSPGSTETTKYPDGTSVALVQRADPRFGMQAPVPKLTVTTPGGLTSTVTTERTATLTEPDDLLSAKTLTQTTNINGNTFTSTFDASSRNVTSSTPMGRTSVTTLDSNGRVIARQVPGIEAVYFSYDARGRLSDITQGTLTSVMTYDAEGNLASVTDPLSRTVGFAYDAAGRTTKQTLPDGREILYSYDASGNVATVTPPQRPDHGFNYTPVDLIESYTPPDIGIGATSTIYSYNLDKQPTRVMRPDGATIDFGYDNGGRLSTVTYPQGVMTLSYNAATGNLESIAAPDGGKLTYAYDGSLLTDTTWSGAVSGAVHRTYDNNFRITSESVNGASTVSFQYDLDGLLTQAGSLALSRDAQNGMPTGATLGSVTDTIGYSSFGELAAYQAAYSGAGIFSVSYTRDDLGRISTKSETVEGATHAYSYTYDAAGRLASVSKDGVVVSEYGYDANGNRLSYTTSAGTVAGTYDNQDRLVQYGGATYEYTTNGELRSKTEGGQTTTYEYDVLGNLRSVTLPDGRKIEYLVDGRNRRIGKKVNGALVQGFLYGDGLGPVAEVDGAGNVVSRFVYTGASNVPDYIVKGGATYRVITDHIGSPRLVVDVASGAVAQRMEYDEFGNVVADGNPGFQPFGFAGGLYDRDTGLVRFGARDYEAQAGRWTAKDPIRFAGGDANLFGYVLSDPVNRIDPSGLFNAFEAAKWGTAGAVTAIAGVASLPVWAVVGVGLVAGVLAGGVEMKDIPTQPAEWLWDWVHGEDLRRLNSECDELEQRLEERRNERLKEWRHQQELEKSLWGPYYEMYREMGLL